MVDVPRRPRTLALTILAVLAIVAALRFAEVVLVPIVLGILISYALDPLLTVLVRAHVPRAFGATLLVALLFAGVVAGGYGLRSDAEAFVEQLPDVAHRVGRVLQAHSHGSAVGKVQQAARELEQAASAAAQPSAASPAGGVRPVQIEEPPIKIRDYLFVGSMTAAGVAAQVVVVLFLALYLLAAGDMFRRKLVRIVGPSFTEKKITVEILAEIDRQIARFLLVRTLISAIVALGTWIALEIIGLRHAPMWGVTAGVLNVVPYLGPTIVALAAAVGGFLQFGTTSMAMMTAGATIVVAVFEGYWLTPWLTSRAGQMNAVAVFIGLLFFGWVWGIWGMLLAVPLMMVIKAVSDRVEDLKPISELLGE